MTSSPDTSDISATILTGVTASLPLAFKAVKAILGGSSLSVIVTVCAASVPIVTLSAVPVNVTTNFSLFSSKASSTITALIV